MCEEISHFKFRINLFCYFDAPEWYYNDFALSILLCVLNIVLFLYLLKLAKRAKKVVIEIREPSPIYKDYDETYCEITLLIMRLAQVKIYILMYSTLYAAVSYGVGPNFVSWFESKTF